jgi:hypothetical protein
MARGPMGRYLLVTSAILVITISVVSIKWLNKGSLPLRCGIKTITLQDGQKIYLKRSASSMNHDRMSLSLDGSRCKIPDDAKDYRITSVDAPEFPIFYRAGINEVTIYAPLANPTQQQWPIVVKQEVLDDKKFQLMQLSYQAQGIDKIEIPASELGPCP